MKFHYLSLSVLFVLFQYSFSDVIDNHLAQSECPAENPPDDVLLPAEDCAHFYKCNDGTPVLQSCPDGLLWNDDLKYCDYPENVDCDRTTRPPRPTRPTRPTTRPPRPSTRPPRPTTRPPRPSTRPPRPTTRPPRPSTRPPRPTTRPPRPTTTAPPEHTCPAENSENDVFYPADDCGHYYICDRGELVLQECPSGLHWNDEESQCDYPENAKCENDDKFHHRPTTRPPRPTTTRPTRPPRPTTTRPTRPPRPTTTRPTRPPRPTTTRPTRPPRPTTTRPTRPPRPTTTRPTRPPRPTTTTRPTRPTTETPRPTTEPPKPTCPAENPENDIMYPAEDCGHYYICDHGELVLQECPSGLHWSTEANRCEYPELANCPNS